MDKHTHTHAHAHACSCMHTHKQVLYYHDCAQSLCSCLEQLTGSSQVPEDEELHMASDKLLAEIKALSIVGGSASTAM